MLKQILAVTAVGLRSIPQRLGQSLVIVVGIAGVVAVFRIWRLCSPRTSVTVS